MALCLHSSRFCFRGVVIALQFVLFFSCKDCGVGEPLDSGLTLPISSIFTGRGGRIKLGIKATHILYLHGLRGRIKLGIKATAQRERG